MLVVVIGALLAAVTADVGHPVTADASRFVGLYSSLTTVAGVPAVAYYDPLNADLRVVTSQNAVGSAWRAPVVVLGSNDDVGKFPSLITMNNAPAVAFVDETANAVLFATATDSSGGAWSAATTVVTPTQPLQALSLANCASSSSSSNTPCIAYATSDGVSFAQAGNAGGTAWPAATVIDALGASEVHLALWNGTPCVLYVTDATSEVRFSYAITSDGLQWSAPVVVTAVSGSNGGSVAALVVVSGSPTVVFQSQSQVSVVAAAVDATSGAVSWSNSSPVVVQSSASGGLPSNVMAAVVGGTLYIAWHDAGTFSLLLQGAVDGAATVWTNPPVEVTLVQPPVYAALADVNAYPALTYFDTTAKLLKFVFGVYPSASPSPSPSATASTSASASDSVSVTASESSSTSVTPSDTPSTSPTPSDSPSPGASTSPSPSPSESPSESPSSLASPSTTATTTVAASASPAAVPPQPSSPSSSSAPVAVSGGSTSSAPATSTTTAASATSTAASSTTSTATASPTAAESASPSLSPSSLGADGMVTVLPTGGNVALPAALGSVGAVIAVASLVLLYTAYTRRRAAKHNSADAIKARAAAALAARRASLLPDDVSLAAAEKASAAIRRASLESQERFPTRDGQPSQYVRSVFAERRLSATSSSGLSGYGGTPDPEHDPSHQQQQQRRSSVTPVPPTQPLSASRPGSVDAADSEGILLAHANAEFESAGRPVSLTTGSRPASVHAAGGHSGSPSPAPISAAAAMAVAAATGLPLVSQSTATAVPKPAARALSKSTGPTATAGTTSPLQQQPQHQARPSTTTPVPFIGATPFQPQTLSHLHGPGPVQVVGTKPPTAPGAAVGMLRSLSMKSVKSWRGKGLGGSEGKYSVGDAPPPRLHVGGDGCGAGQGAGPSAFFGASAKVTPRSCSPLVELVDGSDVPQADDIHIQVLFHDDDDDVDAATTASEGGGAVDPGDGNAPVAT